MDVIESLPEGVAALFTRYEYLTLLLLFLISEAGVPLPFPNYLLIIYAAYLAGQGHGNVFLALLFTVLGIVLGAWLLYWVALRGGKPFLLRFGKYIKLQPEKLVRAEEWFAKRGGVAIIGGRLTPGLRIQIAIVAGIFNVRHDVFLYSTAISAIIWTGFYLCVGFLLRTGYDAVAAYLSPGYQLAFAAIILSIAGVAFVAFRAKKRSN
jgi:membrane protein DedA with SNARE-associated domain